MILQDPLVKAVLGIQENKFVDSFLGRQTSPGWDKFSDLVFGERSRPKVGTSFHHGHHKCSPTNDHQLSEVNASRARCCLAVNYSVFILSVKFWCQSCTAKTFGVSCTYQWYWHANSYCRSYGLYFLLIISPKQLQPHYCSYLILLGRFGQRPIFVNHPFDVDYLNNSVWISCYTLISTFK